MTCYLISQRSCRACHWEISKARQSQNDWVVRGGMVDWQDFMQRIFVDFGRGLGENVDMLTTAQPNQSVTLHEGERVILYDSSLEVQGDIHKAHTQDSQRFWVATPDWATQRDRV